MLSKAYVATVQLLITNAKTTEDAVDAIHAQLMLNEYLKDWAFLKIGGQFAYPTERYFDLEDYEEGDFTP